jgi:hypothetical protein
MRRAKGPAPAATSIRTIVGAALAALAVSAFVNHRLDRWAERDNPPAGKFVNVEGVRVHYVERGQGEPLELLQGNGSMIHDFVTSSFIDLAARNYRVIAIDRPGYRHSSRPEAPSGRERRRPISNTRC